MGRGRRLFKHFGHFKFALMDSAQAIIDNQGLIYGVLIYMSIDCYEIARAVHERQELHLLMPPRGAKCVRTLLISGSLQRDVVVGPWADAASEKRLNALLRSDLQRFVKGDKLRATLKPRELKTEDMRLLAESNEVWEFKSKIKRGIRVFGRFVGCDAFIATHWQWRDVLGAYGSPEWEREIKKCHDEWNRILYPCTPHTGALVNDYLTNADDASLYY